MKQSKKSNEMIFNNDLINNWNQRYNFTYSFFFDKDEPQYTSIYGEIFSSRSFKFDQIVHFAKYNLNKYFYYCSHFSSSLLNLVCICSCSVWYCWSAPSSNLPVFACWRIRWQRSVPEGEVVKQNFYQMDIFRVLHNCFQFVK